jgi:hypothetical protein
MVYVRSSGEVKWFMLGPVEKSNGLCWVQWRSQVVYVRSSGEVKWFMLGPVEKSNGLC